MAEGALEVEPGLDVEAPVAASVARCQFDVLGLVIDRRLEVARNVQAQQPGRAEAEIEEDVLNLILRPTLLRSDSQVIQEKRFIGKQAFVKQGD